MDYRKEVESSVDGNTVKGFKANLLRIYFDMCKEANNCPPSSKFYDDVQWCVWEMLFRAAERRKSLTDDTISSINGSSEVAGVKRLLADANIMDWEIPSPCENGLMIGQNAQNVNRLFYDYQIVCLSKFESEQFYNWRTDIHKLLSLSSIIFLDGIKGECSFLEPQVYQSLYSSMTSVIRDAVTFTSDIFCDLQDILNEYNKEFDY
ncbi:hypothetical protein BD560DRAFT_427795 [Blakeslea trispora]|nr:hypothetical protein BD560DRAFT_427795 [Blakeslea trispora]